MVDPDIAALLRQVFGGDRVIGDTAGGQIIGGPRENQGAWLPLVSQPGIPGAPPVQDGAPIPQRPPSPFGPQLQDGPVGENAQLGWGGTPQSFFAGLFSRQPPPPRPLYRNQQQDFMKLLVNALANWNR